MTDSLCDRPTTAFRRFDPSRLRELERYPLPLAAPQDLVATSGRQSFWEAEANYNPLGLFGAAWSRPVFLLPW